MAKREHPDFKTVEASRPDFSADRSWAYSKTPNPAWKLGDGANSTSDEKHVEIDPYAPGRSATLNYSLLISALVPRPIGLVGTRSRDGASTNLAPFSYTSLAAHDPPLFTVSFKGAGARAKDSLRNLLDTGECTINVVSEHMVEAVNATSINAPHGVSEWALAGLTPAKSSVVRASRVQESIFSVEGKLCHHYAFNSRADPSKQAGVLCVVEGVRFWARDDAVDADRGELDMAVLRPVGRVGGLTYVRVLDGLELARPSWSEVEAAGETAGLVAEKGAGE